MTGTVDVEAQVRARAEHYAFPGAPKDAAGTVKVATWNVNSMKVRLPHVLEWLSASDPDVLVLQEIKQLTQTQLATLAMRRVK